MISLVRVDDRLVHAQIVIGWIDFLRCRRIVVADDAVARDAERVDLFRMVVPADVRLDASDIAGLVRAWPGLESADEQILILFETPLALLSAVRLGVKPKEVNLGGMHETPGRGLWMHGLYASDGEIAAIREMMGIGVDFEIRLVPASRRREVETGRSA